MKIAINGAGVGGPALAWWLKHYGHEPLLIEQSPELRAGGYVIDFWGVGYDVAEKMGLIPDIRAKGYQVQEVRFVDKRGRTASGFSADVLNRMTKNRFTSLQRSDLAAAIYGAIENDVETIFGDSIASIDDHGDGVRITFDHAAPRDVDLVIGADGLHSRIRSLAFGPQDRFEVDLGYQVAAFEATGYRHRDDLVYVSHTAPGRQISRFAMRDDRTLFLFVFRNDAMHHSPPRTQDAAKAALREVFADMGWEAKEILATMDDAPDIYFDRVSQIHMDTWSKGRTALIGDAAACVSLLAGEGTGLAMTEAYVLAGELDRANGDHVRAFAEYEKRMMPFLKAKQKSAAKFASTFAPKTALGVKFRDYAMMLARIPFFADLFIGNDLRDDIELPDYQSR